MGRFELQIIMRSDKDGYLAHGMFDGKGVTVFKGSQISVSEQDKKDIRRLRNIRELEKSIAALRQEADSIGGLFGFVKRNKIKKEIEAQQRELESLKRQRH